jgi:hypothetical protein
MAGLGGVTVVVAGVGTRFGSAVAEALTEVGARVVGVGTNLGTLGAALGVGFVPEVEPEGLAGRKDLLRRHRPRLLVITKDVVGWVAASSVLAEGVVIMAVSEDAFEGRGSVADPRLVDVHVGPDAGLRLRGVPSHLAAELHPALVEVEVGLRIAELAERALGRGDRLAAGYRLGADGLVGTDLDLVSTDEADGPGATAAR